MNQITGVLLVNLGTPDSPKPRDVHRYLTEFLLDPRVINGSWLKRQLLVRGIIIPSRYRQSANMYRAIWTDEGSPLKMYGNRVASALQKRLGQKFWVALAMRYQHPSISQVLEEFKKEMVQRLIIVPMFPQYASATTGSVHQRVMEEISKWEVIPELHFINHYATHPSLIQAFCNAASAFTIDNYDHIVFSFHGLPQKQVRNANLHGTCLTSKECCQVLTDENQECYSAQCYSTAHAIAKGLKLDSSRFSICFQSRLGKDPWLQPYASDKIKKLATDGFKRLLVFCPSFVCDCLETTYEIGVEYAKEFKHAGGERLDLVPGLNDSLLWIDALQDLILERMGS